MTIKPPHTLADAGRRQALAGGAAGALAMCFSPPSSAADGLLMEGHRFAASQRVAGQALQLNGAGLRAVAWIKGYAVALYLPQRSSDVATVLAMPGPKRLQLLMLMEAPASELVKAVNKGITRNTSADEREQIKPQWQRFEASMLDVEKVRKGDLVDFDLDTSRGMLFALNGTLQGEVLENNLLFSAVLRSFVGQRPYDPALKAGLLGRA